MNEECREMERGDQFLRTIQAVVAALDAESAATLSRTLTLSNCEVAAMAFTAADALDAVRAHQPDILLAEAILPGGDGAYIARQILHTPLERYPDILLLKPRALELPDAALLGTQLLNRPLTPEVLALALAECRESPCWLPPEKAGQLKSLMNRLGVPPHPGREMLERAAALCWRNRRRLYNLQRDVYPEAARPFGKTAAQAERAIRHVIEAAWRRGDMEQQQAIFGDTIDARRGRPTCGEMIAQLADILRWEG